LRGVAFIGIRGAQAISSPPTTSAARLKAMMLELEEP
jgi:hypothetical protein